jgi:hypothetical protein
MDGQTGSAKREACVVCAMGGISQKIFTVPKFALPPPPLTMSSQIYVFILIYCIRDTRLVCPSIDDSPYYVFVGENITRINTDGRIIFLATGLTGLLRLDLLAVSLSELFKAFFTTQLRLGDETVIGN